MIIDATALPRLITCGGSRSMPAFTPTGMEPPDDEDARNGLAAHWLATEILRGNITDIIGMVDRKAPNGVYFDDDMVDSVTYYTEALASRPTQARFIEHGASITYEGVTINLRPDFIADDRREYGRHVYIDDFKYGWRIVEPKDNWTLIAYAAWHLFNHRVDADTMYHFTIHQPRPYHPEGRSRSVTMYAGAVYELVRFMFASLRDGSDTLTTSVHCYKCPSRSNCPALRKATMNVLDMTERRLPDELTPVDLSYMLDALTSAERIIKDYRTALQERVFSAVHSGQLVPNYSFVPAEKPLKWKDGVTADVLRILKPGAVVSKEKLITPTQAKKIIPEVIVMTLAEREPAGMKLVRRDAQQLADELFSNHKKEN